MVATSGDRLLAAEAVDALRTKLIPLALADHAEPARGRRAARRRGRRTRPTIESQGKRLLAMGCRAVLIKGGHGQGAESIDYLVTR